jgi:PE family
MTLRRVPEGLADGIAGVNALTARVVPADAGAIPWVTAVATPAADPVSVQGAAVSSAAGGEHTAVAAHGGKEVGCSGLGAGASGTRYPIGDAAAASSYPIAGGLR